MIVRLPFPDAALFPNRRNGRAFGATAHAKKAQRDAAFWLTRKAVEGGWAAPGQDDDVAVSLLFVVPDRRHRDLDNMVAASKALLDGVAQGLNLDDKRFKPLLCDWVRGEAPGSLIVAVGVKIVSSVEIQP